jgi:hypothetical protein
MTKARAIWIWIKSVSWWFWIERVSWIVILLGIPSYFLDQYFRGEIERATNTLEFVKKYQDPHMVGERFVLLEPWLQYNIADLEAQGVSTRTITDTVFKMIDLSKGTKHDMRTAVFDIVDFYETLLVCINIRRCDRGIATSYFREYANEFYCLYRPYILQLKRQRQLPTNYACGLEGFAGACGSGLQAPLPAGSTHSLSAEKGATTSIVRSSPVITSTGPAACQ